MSNKLSSSYEIYEKNLHFLRENNSDLVKKLENLSDKDNPYRKIRSGDPGYFNLIKNKIPIYPQKNFSHWVNGFSEMGENIIFPVFLGCGLGYHINQIIQKYSYSIKEILIVEKDYYLIKESLSLHDWSGIIKSQKLSFLTYSSIEDFRLKFYSYICEQLRYSFSGVLKIIEDNCFNRKQLKDEFWELTQKIVRSFSLKMRKVGNAPQDVIDGIRNIIQNYSRLKSVFPIESYEDQFKNIPAVIISAGPSLEKELELLKSVQNNVLIFSSDTGLRILIEKGITPHFVTSLERVEITANLLKGFSEEEIGNVSFIYSPVVTESAWKCTENSRQILFVTGQGYVDWFKLGKPNPAGASTSTMAFKSASIMGCNPILFLGQDLCLGADGQTHANGSTRGTVQKEIFQLPSTILENNLGQEVKSTIIWKLFLDQFEDFISKFSGKCFNASERGAKIQGAPFFPFQEWSAIYLKDKLNIHSIYENVTNQFEDFEENFQENLITEEVVKLTEKYWKEWDHKKEELKNALTDKNSNLLPLILLCESTIAQTFNSESIGNLIFSVLEPVYINLKIQAYVIESKINHQSPERLEILAEKYYLRLFDQGEQLLKMIYDLLLDNLSEESLKE